MTRLAFRERAAWLIALAAALMLFVQLSAERWRGRARAEAVSAAEQQRARCVAELRSVHAEEAARREALSIVSSQSARIVVFAPQWGAPETVKALLDLPQQKGMILSAGLVPHAGKDYQLWIIRGTSPPRSAGLLRPQPSGALLAAIDPAFLDVPPDALAISLEPEGGSKSGKPSADIVFIGNVYRS